MFVFTLFYGVVSYFLGYTIGVSHRTEKKKRRK